MRHRHWRSHRPRRHGRCHGNRRRLGPPHRCQHPRRPRRRRTRRALRLHPTRLCRSWSRVAIDRISGFAAVAGWRAIAAIVDRRARAAPPRPPGSRARAGNERFDEVRLVWVVAPRLPGPGEHHVGMLARRPWRGPAMPWACGRTGRSSRRPDGASRVASPSPPPAPVVGMLGWPPGQPHPAALAAQRRGVSRDARRSSRSCSPGADATVEAISFACVPVSSPSTNAARGGANEWSASWAAVVSVRPPHPPTTLSPRRAISRDETPSGRYWPDSATRPAQSVLPAAARCSGPGGC